MKSCGGDVWSTWAGQQPSHDAFGFDGYQWLLDGSPIAGQTGSSYTPTQGDAGHQLSCTVTVTYPLLVVTVSATSAQVTVEGAAAQLTDLGAAVGGVGPGRSLAGKAAAIAGYVAANDTVDACASLDPFVSEVNAQTGKIDQHDAGGVVHRAGAGHRSCARLLAGAAGEARHGGPPRGYCRAKSKLSSRTPLSAIAARTLAWQSDSSSIVRSTP